MLTPPVKRHLLKSDPVMAELVRRSDVSRYQLRDNTFRGLVESIVGQQLSVRAARTIKQRLWEALGTRKYKPQHIINTTTKKLRACGLSNSKVEYIKGLAAAAITKELNLKMISKMDDDQVIEELTKHKGVGKWTAEMFLIFSLGRLDVLSLGDWGIRNAMIRLYGLKNPTDKKLLFIAEKWRPYRSIASFYLWASLDNQ